MKVVSLFSCVMLSAIFYSSAQLKNKNVQHTITLKSGLTFKLSTPPKYKIIVAAEVKNRLRFLAKSPDGRLFATDMYNRGDNRLGRVLIFDQWNANTHTYDTTIEFLTKLRNPNQIAFYSVNTTHYLYVAETGTIKRFNYQLGQNKAADTGIVIARYPDYGLDYKYGGWHLTRSITFHNQKLYVSIGSSCNACVEKETERAVIMEMNVDGTNKQIYATGLRNSVGIKFIENKLWATSMGRDLIGPDKPQDLMMPILKNTFYGWPYYYQFQNKIYEDASFKDSDKPKNPKKPPLAPISFKAHSAPLGFEYIQHFIDTYINNKFLVALHGSTSVWRQRGNSVVLIEKNGNYSDFVSGFLQGKTEKERYGRPCDIMQWDNHSIFITDDKNGVLYYLYQ